MNSSSQLDIHSCFINSPMRTIFILNDFINMFLLPLFLSILYAAFCQTSSFTHSDMFTFHMVAIELIGVAGSFMRVYIILAKHTYILKLGMKLYYFIWYGQVFFHILTCVDRYLAVVHPVTYLRLRQSVRLRNITIAGAWLFCIIQAICLHFSLHSNIMDIIILCLALIVATFCSLSILYSLVGPGRGLKCRNKINQSKRRAFHTILVILAVLYLRHSCGLTTHFVFNIFPHFTFSQCVLAVVNFTMCLPSSLVLPLLFLHKTWPLHGCQ